MMVVNFWVMERWGSLMVEMMFWSERSSGGFWAFWETFWVSSSCD